MRGIFIGVFAMGLTVLSCARPHGPAPRHPIDSALRASLPPSSDESLDGPPGAPERTIIVLDVVTTLEEAQDSVNCEIDARGLVAEEVRQYITEFMSPISRTRQYRRRYPAALKYIPIILDLVEADMERHFPEHDPLDPLIIAVIIAYESSWDHTVIGKLGERGYMQIHGEVALYGFEEADLDDPVIQLDAGIRHWRRAVNRCPGDLRGALTLYGTGKRCRPYADFVKWRWRAYQKALESFRFGKEKTHERTEISPCAGDAQGDAQGNQ